MNSKQRIRAVLSHQKPDRLPSTMQCVDTTWEKLRKHLNVNTNDEVMEQLDIDTRIMDIPPYIGPDLPSYVNEHGETVYTHPFGYEYINKWNGVEYNSLIVSTPYDVVKTMADSETFDGWINPDMFDYDAVRKFCDLHQDKAIRIGWPGPYQVFTLLYDTQEFYIKMIENPDLIKAMLNKYCDTVLEMYERMFIASDDRIDILRCCDDYGTQSSLLIGPEMWEEFFAENTKRFVSLAHKHNCFYMQHSCGAIRNIIPNLIACGVDAIEPIQKVVGLEPASLKATYGDKLIFQGGIDTQGVLPLGTAMEVLEETKQVVGDFYINGGYILAPSQDFEGDVPVENILAMYKVRESLH